MQLSRVKGTWASSSEQQVTAGRAGAAIAPPPRRRHGRPRVVQPLSGQRARVEHSFSNHKRGHISHWNTSPTGPLAMDRQLQRAKVGHNRTTAKLCPFLQLCGRLCTTHDYYGAPGVHVEVLKITAGSAPKHRNGPHAARFQGESQTPPTGARGTGAGGASGRVSAARQTRIRRTRLGSGDVLQTETVAFPGEKRRYPVVGRFASFVPPRCRVSQTCKLVIVDVAMVALW